MSYLLDLRRGPRSVLIKQDIGKRAEITCTVIKRDRDKIQTCQERQGRSQIKTAIYRIRAQASTLRCRWRPQNSH